MLHEAFVTSVSHDVSEFAARIAQRFGTPLPDEHAAHGLAHLFPTPAALADADLAEIGLTRARADTVRGLLLDSGLDRAKVRAVGMGKRQPLVTDCEGTRATPELVKCLQPNRRVEIEVVGGN